MSGEGWEKEEIKRREGRDKRREGGETEEGRKREGWEKAERIRREV